MRFIVWITIKLLRSKRITGEQKTVLMAALLDNIHAMPIKDIVLFNADRTMTINGRKLDIEQAISFSESTIGLKNSYARNIINSQLIYEALKLGTYSGMTPEQIQFSKAALWVIQEENRLIDMVAKE